MNKISKLKTVIRISLFSLLMILMTGVDSLSAENGKSKQVSEKKSEIPKPIVDETPINPTNVKKGSIQKSDSKDSSDTSTSKQKSKKKKK